MTESSPIERLSEIVTLFGDLQEENVELRESIDEVRALLSADDRGWVIIQGLHSGDRLEGLDLSEIHDIIKMLQPRVAAAGLTKRAVDLHSGHVFGKGVTISGTEKPSGSGARPAVYRFYTDPRNQESLFTPSAQEELQKARFIEGNVIAACNTSTKTVDIIPFLEIVGVKTDPDFPTRILAYKRQWDYTVGDKTEKKAVWYLTRRWSGKKPGSFGEGNERVPVDQNVVAVDLRANRQPGFILGIPDGVAGAAWAESYTQHLRYGQIVTEGLARLIFKITNKSKKQTQNSAVKFSAASAIGGAASMGEGQDVEAIRTAGSAYKFGELRPIAALAASAWNVANADLLNDSAAAGSSYGALSALGAGNRNAMTLMQREWTTFFQDIFQVMGFDRPDVHWEPLETPDPYRAAQSLTLISPVLSDEEYRAKGLDILDITGNPNTIPPTLRMRSQPADTAAQQAAPDQGRSSGTGSGGSGSNDLRDNTISSQEALRREMALSDIATRMDTAIARFEELQAN